MEVRKGSSYTYWSPRGTHHASEAFDHRIQSEVTIKPHNWPRYPIPPPYKSKQNCQWRIRKKKQRKRRRTAPVVRTIFSGPGVYPPGSVAFLSRKNTNRSEIRTPICLFTFAALFPFGKSRMSPTAHIEGCDVSYSVGCTLTKPSAESELWPRASDIQVVFDLCP